MKKSKKAENKKGFLVRLGDFVTDHRYFFLVLFLGLSFFCCLNINNVNINNSIVSYLPEDTETKQGLDIMDAEFGSLNTMRLMVKNVTPEKAAFLSSDSQLCDEMSSRGLPALHYSRARVYYNKLSLDKILGT